MSKKIKDNRFICLSAILRAKEARMLSGAKLERMLAEPVFADACRIAAESGYEDMSNMDVAGINAALAEFRARELAEIAELAPDMAVLDLFRMRYGYHNAKVIVKSMGDLEKDADLIADLIGCEAVDEQGCTVGTLTDVLQYGTVDTWVFRTVGGTLMAPALKAVFPEVDTEGKRIRVVRDRLEEVSVRT